MKEVNLQDHIALCHWMSRRYGWSGASQEDMVSSAMIGLAIAKERFDPSKGYKFVTYATWYVRSYVQKVVNHHIKENHQSLDEQDDNGRSRIEKIASSGNEMQIDQSPQIHLLLAALSKKESAVIGRRFSLDIPFDSSDRREVIRSKEAEAINSMRVGV